MPMGWILTSWPSLIRQESEFNPNAVSNKNALGLMQLLPRVGKGVAKQVKLKHFSAPQLFTPAVNLQLGTRYFRSMVDQFGGFEYALAAYNAGDDRVKDWQSAGKYRDIQEFVESIPFTENHDTSKRLCAMPIFIASVRGTVAVWAGQFVRPSVIT